MITRCHDNNLSASARSRQESELIIGWFKKNQMIVKLGKFQVKIIDKKKIDHTNDNIVIDNKQIKSVSSVELLGIHLVDKLNFSPHISNIYNHAAKQLNSLIRVKKKVSKKRKL